MGSISWPDSYGVNLGDNLTISLPKITCPDTGLTIYGFDPVGKNKWNKAAAEALCKKINYAGLDNSFDTILVPASKPFEMAMWLTDLLGHSSYVPLRKEKKLYMVNPQSVTIESAYDGRSRTFCWGDGEVAQLKGKRVAVFEDVVSSGGTLDGVFAVAKAIGFEVVFIACVLTEGQQHTDFNGVQIISLDHIPFPGVLQKV
ncbi:MAG: hypothetical protein LBG64_03255 [Pseudomonadales bacterium]|jgi:adenine phosphoribosyltransferase|nr:hypothetical protein [Pseudomonadales bacterium]